MECGAAGAAGAPGPCWVLLLGFQAVGLGRHRAAVAVVKKCNCTGGVGVEGFKINPHLHQGPLMLVWSPCRSVLAVHY